MQKFTKTKFILFAHPRTGSTLLTLLLDMHPDIECDGEVLLPFVRGQIDRKFFRLYPEKRAWLAKTRVYGCGIKLAQLLEVHPKPQQLIIDLSQNGWQFIYLTRLNVLRIAISNIRKLQSNLCHVKVGFTRVTIPKTHIDCQQLLGELNWHAQIIKQQKEMMAGISHLPLIYEEDLFNDAAHQSTANRIFDFLGVDPVPVKAQIQRLSTKRLADTVANYDEMVRFIKQTKYAYLLH